MSDNAWLAVVLMIFAICGTACTVTASNNSERQHEFDLAHGCTLNGFGTLKCGVK